MGRNRTEWTCASMLRRRTLAKTKGAGLRNHKQHKCWTANGFLRQDGVRFIDTKTEHMKQDARDLE